MQRQTATPTQFANSINELQARLGNIVRAGLETKDVEVLRSISDEMARIMADKIKVDELLESLLFEKTQDLLPGDTIHFGLYKYEKVQKKSASKLDETKLSQLIQDQDLLDSCFEIVKKPLTQAKLSKVFAENQINIDIKQLYNQEFKNEFTIKPKN